MYLRGSINSYGDLTNFDCLFPAVTSREPQSEGADSEDESNSGDDVDIAPLHLDLDPSKAGTSKIERQEWVYTICELNADIRHFTQSMIALACICLSS